MKWASFYVLVLMIVLGSSRTCYSQITEYIHYNTLGVNDNVNLAYTRKCIEDKNGFIWAATPDGLFKYDGKDYIQFLKNSRKQRQKILAADCFDLAYKSGDSLLYVINPYDGLNIININSNAVFITKTEAELGFTPEKQWLKSCIRKDNFLYILTDSSILSIEVVSGKKILKKLPIGNDGFFSKIFLYHNQIFIINCFLQVYRCSEDLSSVYKMSESIYPNQLINYVSVNQDQLFVASDNGIKIFDLKNKALEISNILLHCISASLANDPARILIRIGDSILFSNNKGLFCYNIKANLVSVLVNHIKNRRGELQNAADILVTENNYILSITSGLAFLHRRHDLASPVNDIETKDGNTINVFGLCASQQKFFVAAQNSLYEYDPKTATYSERMPGIFVYSLLSLADKNTICSATEGLFIINSNKVEKVEKVYPELSRLKKDLFISMRKVSDYEIIFGSEYTGQLFLWDTKRHTVENLNMNIATLSKNLINNIFVKNKDSIYVIGELYVDLLNLNNRQSHCILKQQDLGNKSADVFMDACTAGGYTWIAAYGQGIVQLDNKNKVVNTIGVDDGINNGSCFRIFNVRDSFIVLTTNNGLSVYNLISKKIQNFFGADGLHGNVFNEASGWQDSAAIYAGGIGGFSKINTNQFYSNTAPPQLYFQEITITTENKIIDTTNLLIKALDIPSDYTQTKISFVGLNHQNPTRVNYWYRITELNNNWIDLKNQNFIDLIGIRPGKYHLQVKAANEDGVECEPIDLELHFLPKWYQTLVFKILTASSIGFILFALYKFRIGQLKKVLQVRQKISQNLHDDIGSTLSAISLYAQVAKLKDSTNATIDNIDTNSKEVLDKLDDIIWATNPKNDKIKNLVERMEGFAKPLLNAHNIDFVFEHSDDINEHKIGEAIRQNLFIIFKETVNNLVKHAQCKTCTVSLSQKNKSILYAITDNGIGFDAAKSSERNGLINLQMRVLELKGKIAIKSQPGSGTTIQIQLPV